jgi:hypothetical protein
MASPTLLSGEGPMTEDGTLPRGPSGLSRRALRLFGAQVGGALMIVGGLLVWRDHEWGKIPFVLGAVFAFFGLTTLPPARLLYRGWHDFANGMFWAWTRVALFLTFWLAVVPVAWIGRLVGRDRMALRFPGKDASYWREHKKDDDPDRYRRQF